MELVLRHLRKLSRDLSIELFRVDVFRIAVYAGRQTANRKRTVNLVRKQIPIFKWLDTKWSGILDTIWNPGNLTTPE